MVVCLGFSRRDIAQVRHQLVMVGPRDPFERGEFDGFLALAWCPPVNQRGLLQTVDGLGQGVVVAVALAAHRGLDARLGQSLGVARMLDVLRTYARMVD